MKITIDTKEDSADEIKKVVKMLQAWVEEHSSSGSYTNIFESGSPELSGPSDISPSSSGPQPSASPGLFNIFGDTEQDNSQDSGSGSRIIDFGDKNDPDDSPKIITY